MATTCSSPSVFWGSGDRRREGVAFSFSVRVVAAALLTVQADYSTRRNFNASSMSAGMGAVNFTFFPVLGWVKASLCACSKTRGAL